MARLFVKDKVITQQSPRSGRTKIAQRFIAGNSVELEPKSAKRTAEVSYRTASGSERMQRSTCALDPVATAPGSVTSVARFTGWDSLLAGSPALKCWAIFKSSASRT